jgi:phytanoyl-CoA dioxygenase PhyH
MTTESVEVPAEAALPLANRRIAMPEFELGDELTPEQLDYLDTYGFIRFRRFASRDTVKGLVEEVEEIDRRLVAEGRTYVNGIPLVFGARKDGTRFVQRMCFASTFGPRLHDFITGGRYAPILKVAGPGYRIGERERDGLVVNHYIREEGSKFKRQGWHTDSLRDLFYLEKPRRYLNVGFYLDDSPITKGGVRVIPHSHKQGIWPMLTRKKYFIDCEPDRDEYAIVAEAGDLTIHDGRLWHRVAEATATGDASRRRVMYLPLMDGPEKRKDESSPTPLYFKLQRFAKN